MKDRTPIPRKISYTPERLESILAAALEHAAHGWAALEKRIPVNRINPDSWPPIIEAEVGSAEYHLSITIIALFESFQSIHEEAEHTRRVTDLVDQYLANKNGE